jgi:hypothetical protein
MPLSDQEVPKTAKSKDENSTKTAKLKEDAVVQTAKFKEDSIKNAVLTITERTNLETYHQSQENSPTNEPDSDKKAGVFI